MPKVTRIIAVGDIYNRFTVISEPYQRPAISDSKQLEIWVDCRCQCGTVKAVRKKSLLSTTKSCGCFNREINAVRIRKQNLKHGKALAGRPDPIYRVWLGIKRRCYDQDDTSYQNYGGRGIAVCDAWLSSFEAFYDWAIATGYARGLTLERKNNDKGYGPGNCKWIPRSEQAQNRRGNINVTINGETKNVRGWAEDARCPVDHSSIHRRINYGWHPVSAILTPARKKQVLPGPNDFVDWTPRKDRARRIEAERRKAVGQAA